MKYAEFNGRTFRQHSTTCGDEIVGSLINIALEQSEAQSVAQMLLHPALPLNSTDLPQFTVHGCPVCKNVYFNQDEALHCADGERELAQKFANIKVGDWLRYEECGVGKTAEVFFVQVSRFSFVYDGFNCGSILTIHYDGGFINAKNRQHLSFWHPSSLAEKDAFEIEQKRREIEVRKIELAQLENSLGLSSSQVG